MRERKSEEVRKDHEFNTLPVYRQPGSYALDADPNNYHHPTPDKKKNESRLQHIEAHTTWSPYSKVCSQKGGKGKSETALASNHQDAAALLRAAAVIASSTNADRIREYVDAKHGRIIKVTLTDSARIEVTVIEPAPGTKGHNGHELVSTYDGYTVGQALGKLTPNPYTGKVDWK